MSHIVYINKVLLDSTIPAVNFSLGNACGFARAGARTTLMAQVQGDTFEESEFLRRFELEPLPDLTIRVWKKRRRWGVRSNQWFYLEALSAMREVHERSPIDWVVTRDPGALPYLVIMRKRHGVAVYYQPHNFYANLKVREDVESKVAGKYHLLERTCIPKMNGLLCLQEAQARWYRRSFPGLPVYAAEPGVLSVRPGAGTARPRYQLGYVGSLQEKKGVDVVLRALRKMGDGSRRLLLVGGRDEFEISSTRARILEMGLEQRVDMTGWVPYGEVLRSLEDVAVGLLPLNDTFYNRYLTAPNKLFDYISRGVPVIASDLPAIRELVTAESGVVFVPPDDADALAAAADQLLGNEQLYASHVHRALEAARNADWKTRAEKMIRMMEKSSTAVAGTRPGSR